MSKVWTCSTNRWWWDSRRRRWDHRDSTEVDRPRRKTDRSIGRTSVEWQIEEQTKRMQLVARAVARHSTMMTLTPARRRSLPLSSVAFFVLVLTHSRQCHHSHHHHHNHHHFDAILCFCFLFLFPCNNFFGCLRLQNLSSIIILLFYVN